MRFMLSLALLLSLWNASFTQDYYEGFGQTRPFTLAAGSTGNWDSTLSAARPALTAMPALTSISAFPNPASGSLRLRLFPGTDLASVNIHDLSGKVILRALLGRERNEIKLPESLPNGVYVARVVVRGNAKQTVRFLVAR